MEFLNDIYQWFINIPWRGIYFFIKDVVIVLDVALIFGFVWVFIKALEYRPKFFFDPKPSRKKEILKDPEILKRWKLVLERSASSPPQSFTLAIIEADKFVDDILKKLGFKGEHMADRLERLGSHDLRTLDKLWRVHKIRNELVHNPDFNISAVDSKEVLDAYEAFLKEIEVL